MLQLSLYLLFPVAIFLERGSQAVDRVCDSADFIRILVGRDSRREVALQSFESSLNLSYSALHVSDHEECQDYARQSRWPQDNSGQVRPKPVRSRQARQPFQCPGAANRFGAVGERYGGDQNEILGARYDLFDWLVGKSCLPSGLQNLLRFLKREIAVGHLLVPFLRGKAITYERIPCHRVVATFDIVSALQYDTAQESQGLPRR